MALNNETEIASIRARLKELDAERDALTVCLERLASEPSSGANCKSDSSSVTAASTAANKITLFRRLFAGRSEVFPIRWENRSTGKSGYAPACANEWVRGVCGKPQVKCGECPNQAFIALSDNVIASHLRGADPSRSSSTDFVAGVYPVRIDETCWFLAVDFDGDDWSIDALAYIETCRLRSVPAALERSRTGEGVRTPISEENGDEPWRQTPSLRHSPERVTEPLPDRIKVVLSDDIYVDRRALPPSMVAMLIRLAAFQNPEFYRAQAMRLSTFGKPRIISCASLHKNYLALPRGCLEETLELLRSHAVEPDIEDLREPGTKPRPSNTLPSRCARSRHRYALQWIRESYRQRPGFLDSWDQDECIRGSEFDKTPGRAAAFRLCQQCDQLRLSVPALCVGAPGKRSGKRCK